MTFDTLFIYLVQVRAVVASVSFEFLSNGGVWWKCEWMFPYHLHLVNTVNSCFFLKSSTIHCSTSSSKSGDVLSFPLYLKHHNCLPEFLLPISTQLLMLLHHGYRVTSCTFDALFLFIYSTCKYKLWAWILYSRSTTGGQINLSIKIRQVLKITSSQNLVQ